MNTTHSTQNTHTVRTFRERMFARHCVSSHEAVEALGLEQHLARQGEARRGGVGVKEGEREERGRRERVSERERVRESK